MNGTITTKLTFPNNLTSIAEARNPFLRQGISKWSKEHIPLHDPSTSLPFLKSMLSEIIKILKMRKPVLGVGGGWWGVVCLFLRIPMTLNCFLALQYLPEELLCLH